MSSSSVKLAQRGSNANVLGIPMLVARKRHRLALIFFAPIAFFFTSGVLYFLIVKTTATVCQACRARTTKMLQKRIAQRMYLFLLKQLRVTICGGDNVLNGPCYQ